MSFSESAVRVSRPGGSQIGSRRSAAPTSAFCGRRDSTRPGRWRQSARSPSTSGTRNCRTSAARRSPSERRSGVKAGLAGRSWWMYCIACAFGLVLVEWWTWQRRITYEAARNRDLRWSLPGPPLGALAVAGRAARVAGRVHGAEQLHSRQRWLQASRALCFSACWRSRLPGPGRNRNGRHVHRVRGRRVVQRRRALRSRGRRRNRRHEAALSVHLIRGSSRSGRRWSRCRTPPRCVNWPAWTRRRPPHRTSIGRARISKWRWRRLEQSSRQATCRASFCSPTDGRRQETPMRPW